MHGVKGTMNSFVKALLVLCLVHCSFCLNGTVEDDAPFFTVELSRTPATKLTVMFEVTCNVEAMVYLDVHTTRDFNRKCSSGKVGQLAHEGLHIRLKEGKLSCFVNCKPCQNNQLKCEGEVTLQDYEPRRASVSLGFSCDDAGRSSLKGISYNFRVGHESNATDVLDMPPNNLNCSRFYPKTTLPNLLGDLTFLDVNEKLESLLNVNTAMDHVGASYTIMRSYQHMTEALCHIFYPEFDDTTNQVIQPCAELCRDVQDSCKVLNEIQHFDCDYLPSVKDHPTRCFYKSVQCGAPPVVRNGLTISSLSKNNTYPLGHSIAYSCLNETFSMQGKATVSCKYNGDWSKPPVCRRITDFTLNWELGILIVIVFLCFVVLVALMCYAKCKRRREEGRGRRYDGFVCYNFEENGDFVFSVLLPGLEKDLDTILFICDRDFVPGKLIQDNIQFAVQNSNSAILLMSQGFVNSPWCREEFNHCVTENVLDPRFKLLVVAMEPDVEGLKNITDSMKNLLRQRTYLKHDDPKLLEKIRDELKHRP